MQGEYMLYMDHNTNSAIQLKAAGEAYNLDPEAPNVRAPIACRGYRTKALGATEATCDLYCRP
eukprot:1862606-Karenia_brevis.AAC.1